MEERINLSNDVLFGLVMDDPETCRRMLEILLGFPLKKVKVQTQKWIKEGFYTKGSRLDVFAVDCDGNNYDIEIQTTRSQVFGKRLRYYQSQCDLDSLKTGEDYGALKKSYIIFICTFDPFNEGLWKYTFSPKCEEENIDIVTDQMWLVFNTQGRQGDIPDETKDFLSFVRESTPENATTPYLREIRRSMDCFLSSEWRKHIVERLGKDDLIAIESRAEGRAEGVLLKTVSLILKKRARGMTAEAIGEDLLEEETFVRRIFELADSGKDADGIVKSLISG